MLAVASFTASFSLSTESLEASPLLLVVAGGDVAIVDASAADGGYVDPALMRAKRYSLMALGCCCCRCNCRCMAKGGSKRGPSNVGAVAATLGACGCELAATKACVSCGKAGTLLLINGGGVVLALCGTSGLACGVGRDGGFWI